MRLLLALLFFFHWSHSFAYSEKDIKLTTYEYQNLVRPSLKQIYENYKNLIVKLSSKNKNLISIFDEYDSIEKNNINFKESCSKIENKSCLSAIDSYLASLKKISLTLEKDTGFHTTGPHYQAYRTQTLENYNQLYNFRYLYEAKVYEKKSLWPILKKIEESYNEFNFLTIKQSLPQVEEQLSAFWSNYIRVLFKEILKSKNKDLFKKRLTDLNQNWNLFHVMLTKRNVEVPKSAKQVLLSMHRRWNYILKVTLR